MGDRSDIPVIDLDDPPSPPSAGPLPPRTVNLDGEAEASPLVNLDEPDPADNPQIERLPSGMIRQKLVYPLRIAVGGETRTIDSLLYRIPTMGDMRTLRPQDGHAVLSQLVAKLTNQPERLIDALQGEDITAAGDVIGIFFPSGRRTGRNSSRP